MIRGSRALGIAGIGALAMVGVLLTTSPGHAAPPDGTGATATRTIWARSGARSWSQCGEKAREAAQQTPTRVSEDLRDHRWARLARDCPHTLEILKLAAQTEMLRAFRLPSDADGETDLGPLEKRRLESRQRALEWIDRAFEESRLRGEHEPIDLDYMRGKALLTQGKYDEADGAFENAAMRRGVAPYRVQRMMALTALFRGEIDSAQALSFRGLIDTPKGVGHMTSRYIHALVLERSGDPANARELMKRTLGQDGDRASFMALTLVLPLHERLYLEALKAEALGDEAQARRLWGAYLASPHPEAPERRLAERHLAELRVLPNKLGG